MASDSEPARYTVHSTSTKYLDLVPIEPIAPAQVPCIHRRLLEPWISLGQPAPTKSLEAEFSHSLQTALVLGLRPLGAASQDRVDYDFTPSNCGPGRIALNILALELRLPREPFSNQQPSRNHQYFVSQRARRRCSLPATRTSLACIRGLYEDYPARTPPSPACQVFQCHSHALHPQRRQHAQHPPSFHHGCFQRPVLVWRCRPAAPGHDAEVSALPLPSTKSASRRRVQVSWCSEDADGQSRQDPVPALLLSSLSLAAMW